MQCDLYTDEHTADTQTHHMIHIQCYCVRRTFSHCWCWWLGYRNEGYPAGKILL